MTTVQRRQFDVGDFVWVDTNCADDPRGWNPYLGFFGWVMERQPGLNLYHQEIPAYSVYQVARYQPIRGRNYLERCLPGQVFRASWTFLGPVTLYHDDDTRRFTQ